MIALCSALLGFVSSAFPEFIRLFRDGRDRAHELALLKLQMEYDREKLAAQSETARQDYAYKLQEIAVTERQALNDGAGTASGRMGIGWVDALAGSVRPVVTYGFFLLYVAVKGGQFHLLVNPSLPWQQAMGVAEALVSLWNEEDMGMFAAVMAFWFGSRALGRARRA